MPSLTSLARISTAAAFIGAVAMANACGGQSFTSGNEDGGSSNGGTSQGGSTSHAGTHSTAGKAAGGTGTAGTGITAGAGGAGGNDACNSPAASGPCDAAFQRWYHDPISGTCQQFLWGGCGGNANRYDSQAACEAACPSPVDIYSCKLASDCVVTTASCCGVCDGPHLTAQDFVAYNESYAGLPCNGIATRALPAGGSSSSFPGEGAPPMACPSCPAPLPGQGTRKYFVPACVEGQCAVADLRTSPLSACKTTADCKLRSGTSCCGGCGGDDFVAVRSDGSFEKWACSGAPQACPACVALPPMDAEAWCNAMTGHCEIAYGAPAASP